MTIWLNNNKEGKFIKALLDTGSANSILPYKYKECGNVVVTKNKASLLGASGAKLNRDSTVKANIKVEGRDMGDYRFYVLTENSF